MSCLAHDTLSRAVEVFTNKSPKEGSNMRQNYDIHILILRESNGECDGWIFQCLEYDIVAQGKTLSEAKRRFQRTIIGQIVVDIEHGNQIFEGIGEAPQKYWDQFEEGHRLADQPEFDVPNINDHISPPRAIAKGTRIYA